VLNPEDPGEETDEPTGEAPPPGERAPTGPGGQTLPAAGEPRP
jgi:hypothetical protein